MSASEPLSSEIDHLVQPKSKTVETGKRIQPGQKLSDAYCNASRPVVQQPLYQASIRLATLLNEAFPGDGNRDAIRIDSNPLLRIPRSRPGFPPPLDCSTAPCCPVLKRPRRKSKPARPAVQIAERLGG